MDICARHCLLLGGGEAPFRADEPCDVSGGGPGRLGAGIFHCAEVTGSGKFRQRGGQLYRRRNLRQERISGLLAPLLQQRFPAVAPLRGRDGTLAEQQTDLPHSEFGGLLEQRVEFGLARHGGIKQQSGFRLRDLFPGDGQQHPSRLHRRERASAAPVQQFDGVAGSGAQRLEQVIAFALRQFDRFAGLSQCVAEKTVHDPYPHLHF